LNTWVLSVQISTHKYFVGSEYYYFTQIPVPMAIGTVGSLKNTTRSFVKQGYNSLKYPAPGISGIERKPKNTFRCGLNNEI